MNKDKLNIEIHLTPQQMSDYLAGNASNAEMHRVEKHLLECDFCAEAMEGLQSMDDFSHFEKDVSTLKASIEKSTKKPEKETVTVPLYTKLLRIAAMLAAIVVASVMVTQFFKSDVELKEYSEKRKTERPKDIKENDKGEKKQTKLKADSTIKPTINKSPKSGPEISKPKTVKEETLIEEKNNWAENDKQTKSIQPVVANEIISSDDEVTLDENVVSAEPEISKGDNSGINSIDLVQEEEIMGVEMEEEAIPATRAKERSTYSMASADSMIDQDKVAANKAITQPKPKNKKAFHKYLSDSLRFPEEALKAKIKGFVLLQVTVDINGDLRNITVLNSLGYGCDEEAIRLIEEGPAWLPGSKNGMAAEMEVELKVKFK